MQNAPNKLPGDGLLGWLGRQFGYVKKAVDTDVTAPPAIAGPQQPAATTIYRDARVEEKESPHDPNMKLRRTVIDEVIVKGAQNSERKTQNE